MDKNDTNCLSSSKAHQHHQRFCQSLSASSGHWMVGRDGRCTSFSQCAFVHLCYRGGNQIRIRWSEQVPFWVRPLPRPLPGLSLGHRVGWGVAPVAAHAAARPPGLPQMLLAFKELWSSAWKSWNYIYICIYIYMYIYIYIYIEFEGRNPRNICSDAGIWFTILFLLVQVSLQILFSFASSIDKWDQRRKPLYL